MRIASPFTRHAELVSASISPFRPERRLASGLTAKWLSQYTSDRAEEWTLKQVQGDEFVVAGVPG